MKKLKELLQKVELNNELIKENTTKKYRTIRRLISYFVAFVIFLTPVVFICNLFIFFDFIYLVALALAIILFLAFVFDEFIYLKLLISDNEALEKINIKENILVKMYQTFLFILIIYIVFSIIMGVYLCL